MMRLAAFALAAVTFLECNVNAFALQRTGCLSSKISDSTRLSVVDDKNEVREYLNSEEFNRWNKIYSKSDEVNNVQLDICKSHGQTIQKIIKLISDDCDTTGKLVCACGCGVGSLAIPLAKMGAKFRPLTFRMPC